MFRAQSVNAHYVCCYCEMAFKKKNLLVKHLWSHEDLSSTPRSTPYHTDVAIKMEDGNESELSDVVDPVPHTMPQLERKRDGLSCSDGRFRRTDYNKQFVSRGKWKMHKIQKACGSSAIGSVTKDTTGPRTRQGRKSSGKQLEKKIAVAAVKVENGNSIPYADNCYPEISSPDVPYDGDDTTEDLETASVGRRRKESSATDSAGKLLDDGATSRTGRRKPSVKKSEPTPARSRTYPCDQCDRVLSSAAAMNYHRRTHSGDKPYACSQCPRRFIIRGQLIEHERIHTGEKPFACDQCPKRFAQSGQLKTHSSIHSEVGTHICPTCGERFTRPWRLQSHLRAAHADDSGSQKRYRCDDCGREYSLRQSWVYHRLTHTSELPFQCEVCLRQFRVAGQLRQHINHCRGRKAQNPTTNPYDQPPQNWLWCSESDTDVLTTPTNIAHVPASSSITGQDLIGTQFHQL